jgi:threonine dehydrogenase-like Zn-dependent dehydrogenase
MKAIEFVYKMPRLALGTILGQFSKKGYLIKHGYIRLKELPDPKILADDWLVIRTKYCGICGSDHKQVFLDGNYDNPMTAIISWPQVLGHEAVGFVEKVGPKVKNLKIGDRVALNPWLSCLPREINPPCEMCAKGKNTLCKNFTKGLLAPGIHTGNSRDATGGFAELVPAHESMAIKIPDYVTWDQAILSDPFSVAFHSILKVKLQPGMTCAVYGCGNLGLLTIHILKRVFTSIKVIAIARFEHQAEMAKIMGADHVLKSSPPNQIIEEIAKITNSEIYFLKKDKPLLIEGVDFLFDTVASPQTLEVGLRITKARIIDPNTHEEIAGSIVVTGVANPKRFEWTPWYFKNIHLIGSNAFAIETFEGRTEHAYYHYYRFLKDKRVDPSPIISHKFRLEDYQKALLTSHMQAKFRSLKIAFEYPIADPITEQKINNAKSEANN